MKDIQYCISMNSRALSAPQTFYNVHSDRWLVPMACMAQEAKFFVHGWADIVDFYNPMPESTISPQSGTKNLAPVPVDKVPRCNSC